MDPGGVSIVNINLFCMTQKYPIVEPRNYYSLTLNTIDRVDIFIRPFFKQIIVESLNYFIEKKGLVVYGWCLMTNHLHLIVRAKDEGDVPRLIRDFKTFTAKIILEDLNTESDMRREWIMKKIREAALFDKLDVWENADHPVQISGENDEIYEYLKEIHNNPVRNKIVESPHDYLHSSARNYAGLKGLVNIQNPMQKNEADVSIYRIPVHNSPIAKGSEYFSY
jgi:REP-associated tyrosine transposase